MSAGRRRKLIAITHSRRVGISKDLSDSRELLLTVCSHSPWCGESRARRHETNLSEGNLPAIGEWKALRSSEFCHKLNLRRQLYSQMGFTCGHRRCKSLYSPEAFDHRSLFHFSRHSRRRASERAGARLSSRRACNSFQSRRISNSALNLDSPPLAAHRLTSNPSRDERKIS